MPASLRSKIAAYESRYMTAGLRRAPTQAEYNRYRNWKKEQFRLDRAAKRIQTAFRTLKTKKATSQLMSYVPNFRRLSEKDQRSIMKMAFRL